MQKFTNFWTFLRKNIASDNENKAMDDHRQYIMAQKQKCLEESRQRQISEIDLREEINRQYMRSLAIQHRRSVMCETYSPNLSVTNTFDMDDDYFHVDDGASNQKSNKKLKAVFKSAREKGSGKKCHALENHIREDEFRKEVLHTHGKSNGESQGANDFEEAKSAKEVTAHALCKPGVESDHLKQESEEAIVFSQWLTEKKTECDITTAVLGANMQQD